MKKARVGPEFWRTTVELADVAENDTHTSMCGENHSAKVDLLISKAIEVAYIFTIGRGTQDGEAALLVWRTGWANV